MGRAERQRLMAYARGAHSAEARESAERLANGARVLEIETRPDASCTGEEHGVALATYFEDTGGDHKVQRFCVWRVDGASPRNAFMGRYLPEGTKTAAAVKAWLARCEEVFD